MKVETLVVGQLQACCYIVACERSKQAMIVDPGDEPERIASAVERENLQVALILNTHGHADHIAANSALKRRFAGASLAIHSSDAAMLEDPQANLSALFGLPITSPSADRVLVDGDVVRLGDVEFSVIHIGGHSPGSICLLTYGDAGSILFSGDTLFAGGIGRTDFPGGDLPELITGIKERLLSLPPETVVYPGHGPATTIREEARTNPFLTASFA